MHFKKIGLILAFLLFLSLLLLSAKNSLEKTSRIKNPEPELKKIKIGMGYIPNVQFAPFYAALEKGYFTDENLELDFNYSLETDIITLLAKNELDIGIGSGEQIILAQNQNLPVINFFNWYQRFPVCLMSLKQKNISEPKDLAGKTIGTPAMQGAKVNIKNIGYTQTESLVNNTVDAAVCYVMNEPVNLKAQGYKLNVLKVSDYVNLVSNGLITSQTSLKQNPEMLNSFTKAFLKGLEFTLNNPDEAFLISKKYIPEIKNDEIQKKILLESIGFWNITKPGLNSKDQWQKSLDFLTEINLVEKKIDVDNLFTNQFLPYEENN